MKNILTYKNKYSEKIFKGNNQLSILIGMILISAIISKGIFISKSNIINLLLQNSIIGVLAMGEFLVILTGGIDLSVGSILTVSSMLCAYFFKNNSSILFSILVTILFGSGLGFLNGLMVSKGKIPPFIATLGMMGIARSVARLINKGSPIWAIPQPFIRFWEEKVVLIPITIIVYITIFLLTFIIIERTYYGRCVYALGSNEKASFLSGISVDKIQIFVYTISGFFCSIGALMFIGRTHFATPDSGSLYHLDAITAVIIGGTSFSGGKGTVIGAFIGLLIVGVLTNLMNIININAFWQQTIKGIVLLIAVYFNKYNIKNDG